MDIAVPEPMKREHEELHAELRRATREPGEVGAAARALAALMLPHFLKEDEYALSRSGCCRPWPPAG